MTDAFHTEVETQERLDTLIREMCSLGQTAAKENKGIEMMVTFSPDFQMKANELCTISLYGNKHERLVNGFTWFTNMGQEEPYKIWIRS